MYTNIHSTVCVTVLREKSCSGVGTFEYDLRKIVFFVLQTSLFTGQATMRVHSGILDINGAKNRNPCKFQGHSGRIITAITRNRLTGRPNDPSCRLSSIWISNTYFQTIYFIDLRVTLVFGRACFCHVTDIEMAKFV